MSHYDRSHGSAKFRQRPFLLTGTTFLTSLPCQLVLTLIILFFLVAEQPVLAQDATGGYRVVRVFSPLSFTQPLLLLQAPDDSERWYVVEQPGTIRTFRTGDVETEVFADLTARITNVNNEQGLLGMTFHPDYPDLPQVFLSYTASDDGRSVISRLQVAPDGLSLNPDTEKIILEVAQPFGNHNGGNIVFGPDGYLYISLGDGGSANDPQNNAQNTTSLLGALLRIDVDSGTPYAVPPGNPFAGNNDCSTNCPEIFAWGLRNPWRFSFDMINEDLWLADVGQNDREEVNRIEAGGNYGWRCYEGNILNPNLSQEQLNLCEPAEAYDFPVVEYPHTVGNCSVIGGYVYRGTLLPELAGRYIFGDFCTGMIAAVVGDGSTGQFELLLVSGISITSFGQDRNGEIYVLDRAGGIYRLERRVAGMGMPWLMQLLDE